jgi:hypothetical protein
MLTSKTVEQMKLFMDSPVFAQKIADVDTMDDFYEKFIDHGVNVTRQEFEEFTSLIGEVRTDELTETDLEFVSGGVAAAVILFGIAIGYASIYCFHTALARIKMKR